MNEVLKYHDYTVYVYDEEMFVYSPESRYIETVRCKDKDIQWLFEKAKERVELHETSVH